MAVATTSRPRVPVLARPTQAELRRSQWTWLAGGLALAFSIPFVLTDLVSIDRDVYYGVFVGAVFAFAGAWLRFGVASPRRVLAHHWPGGIILGLAFVAVMAAIVPTRAGNAASERSGVRRGDRLARRRLRVRRRRDSVRFPDRRGLLRLHRDAVLERRRGKVAIGALALAVSLLFHRRLSPRLLRLPRRKAAQASRRGCHLERADTGDAEPRRLADHSRRPARQRRRTQLRHRHVPATPSDNRSHQPARAPAILDELVGGSRENRARSDRLRRRLAGHLARLLRARDVSTERAHDADARMRLESVSKIWTAVLIHQLAEDGSLRLSDTVERWLPGLLPYGRRITIAQLLTHTSGLIDNNDVAKNPDAYIALVTDPALKAQLLRVKRRFEQRRRPSSRPPSGSSSPHSSRYSASPARSSTTRTSASRSSA